MDKPKVTIETPPEPEAAPNPLDGLCRGRIVYYYPTPGEAHGTNDSGPWPSMVVDCILKTGVCTLHINRPKPPLIGYDPVDRKGLVPFSEDKRPGTWGWMFQGQNTRYKPDRPA